MDNAVSSGLIKEQDFNSLKVLGAQKTGFKACQQESKLVLHKNATLTILTDFFNV